MKKKTNFYLQQDVHTSGSEIEIQQKIYLPRFVKVMPAPSGDRVHCECYRSHGCARWELVPLLGFFFTVARVRRTERL